MEGFELHARELLPRLRTAIEDFVVFSNLSPLATAAWLSKHILQMPPVLTAEIALDMTSPEVSQKIKAIMDGLNSLLKPVCEAGRKDLWDMPDHEARVEAATKSAPWIPNGLIQPME